MLTDLLVRFGHRGENLKVRSEQDINKRGSKRDIRRGVWAALTIARRWEGGEDEAGCRLGEGRRS